MTPWHIALALLSPLCFAIGWCCGRRSDEEQTAHRLLLRARGERIKQLEAEAELAEQQRQSAFRAVEGGL